jgi:hypothetical protein
MGVIREICSRAILLDAGQVSRDGSSSESVNAYLQSGTISKVTRGSTGERIKSAIILELTLTSERGLEVTEFVMGDAIRVAIEIDFVHPVAHPQFGTLIHSVDGTPILDLRTRHNGPDIPLATGRVCISMEVGELNLYPGDYYLSAWVSDASSKDLDLVEYGMRFTVLPVLGPFGDMRLNFNWGKYYVPSQWKLQQSDNSQKELIGGERS